MTKEQQIEEIMYYAKMIFYIFAKVDTEKDLAEIDGNTLDHFAENVARNLYRIGYRKTFTNEIESDTQKAFKEGYEKGMETCGTVWQNGYNDGYDSGFEDGMKEFAEKLKDDIKVYLTEDNDFLMKWSEFRVFIDELLKEYEE